MPITATVTSPVGALAFNAAARRRSFSGSVADNSSGVGLNANSATFTLQRSIDGKYWNGSAWQMNPVSLAATNSATTGNTGATWTSNVTLPNWSAEVDGTTYTVQAIATDKAGNTFSGAAISFTLDSTAPVTASVTTPAGGNFFSASGVPTFSGSVADNTGGGGLSANGTTFTLQSTNGPNVGQYWNGAGWQATPFHLSATNAATTAGASAIWTSSATMPSWSAQPDATYAIQATATDKAGNTFTGSAVSFILDNTGPVTASVTTPTGGNFFQASAVPLTFIGSVADNSGLGGGGLNANSTTFTLQGVSGVNAGQYWNGSVWQSAVFKLAATNPATTGGTATTWTSSATLPTWGARYPDFRHLRDPGDRHRQGRRCFHGQRRHLHPGRYRAQHRRGDDAGQRGLLQRSRGAGGLQRQRCRQQRRRRRECQQHHVHSAKRQRDQRRQILETGSGLASDSGPPGRNQQRDHRKHGSHLDQQRHAPQLAGGNGRQYLFGASDGYRQGRQHLQRHGHSIHPRQRYAHHRLGDDAGGREFLQRNRGAAGLQRPASPTTTAAAASTPTAPRSPC